MYYITLTQIFFKMYRIKIINHFWAVYQVEGIEEMLHTISISFFFIFSGLKEIEIILICVENFPKINMLKEARYYNLS
jgi:hypothetical protein